MSNARIALTLTVVWIVGLIALFVTPFEFVIPTQLSLVVFWWWPIGGIVWAAITYSKNGRHSSHNRRHRLVELAGDACVRTSRAGCPSGRQAGV